jgi:hypothetical protein
LKNIFLCITLSAFIVSPHMYASDLKEPFIINQQADQQASGKSKCCKASMATLILLATAGATAYGLTSSSSSSVSPEPDLFVPCSYLGVLPCGMFPYGEANCLCLPKLNISDPLVATRLRNAFPGAHKFITGTMTCPFEGSEKCATLDDVINCAPYSICNVNITSVEKAKLDTPQFKFKRQCTKNKISAPKTRYRRLHR